MSRIKNSLALVLLAGLTMTGIGVTQSFTIPAVPAETHLLDPLLGHWTYIEDLHNPQHYKANGAWTFTRGADGFVVFDEFRTGNGSGGTAVLAETYRAYNPKTKTWSFQATVYQAPEIGPKNGEWDQGVTRIQEGEILDEITKGDLMTRVRFYNIKKDSFSCRFSPAVWAGAVSVTGCSARIF